MRVPGQKFFVPANKQTIAGMARSYIKGSTRKRYTARVGKSVSSQRLDGVCTAVVVRG
jgi:hypothetical protein